MNNVFKIEKAGSCICEKQKKRVAAYCRVSTSSEEQLESLSAQKKHYESWIKANSEWEYAGLYFDEGLTGTEMTHRKGLTALVSDCEKGKIDHVVIKSISRMARNTVDCLSVVRKLLGLGISIYFEKENLNTEQMDSELFLSILSSLAEDESHSISENCKWGCKKRFRSGTYNFGYVPYGYKAEEGKIIVNPEEAENVKLIFQSYLEGIGSPGIADMLNRKGSKPRRSEKWNDNSIRLILTNEKYTGDCLFQKTYTDDRFTRHVNKGEEEQYYMTDHHEALVSHEDFEKVSQMLERRRKIANVKCDDACYKNRYPFSGKVFCSQCGSSFKRRIVYNGNQSYPILICKNHVDGSRKCTEKSIRVDALESAFTTMFNKLVFAKELVVRPYVESVNASYVSDGSESLESIKKRLDENVRKRQVLANLYAQKLIEQNVYCMENNALISQSIELSKRTKKLSATHDAKYTRQADSMDLLKTVTSTAMQTEFSEELFERLVERIIVISRNEVEFSLKCGLNLREEI